jgi:hypothetical protein
MPRYKNMASGNKSIILDDDVNHFTFPVYAEKWVDILGLKVTYKIDGIYGVCKTILFKS